MSKFIWLPEHSEQLKSLRMVAGIDISTLASNHSLSKMQIKQLEEGGDSSFYTPEIKFTIGRKLIRSFGVDVVNMEYKQVSLESDASTVMNEFTAAQERNRVSIKPSYLIFFVLIFAGLVFLSISKHWFGHRDPVSKEMVPVIILNEKS
jgi:hypothetical protein